MLKLYGSKQIQPDTFSFLIIEHEIETGCFDSDLNRSKIRTMKEAISWNYFLLVTRNIEPGIELFHPILANKILEVKETWHIDVNNF